MKSSLPVVATLVSSLAVMNVQAASDVYGPFPVTVKNYAGNKTDSTAYSGQVARQVLHNSLKKLAGQGTGQPNDELKARMMAYYAGKDAGRAILDPVSKGDFKIKQSAVDEISKGKNLKGKTYKGLVNGWPGQMTGAEVIEHMIDKAASSPKGYDPLTGHDYRQLISKFLMGAVFYSQAVDNYLDEGLEANKKPNDKPYSDGAAYTGKEHVWDEAFGYFGAPAHALKLDAAQVHGIAKQKDVKVADANGDGVVDLLNEMTFGHAYYAADSDKAGTDYLHTITRAFLDGRKLISAADGRALSDSERAKLKGYAEVIKTNWEQVLAEAAFKYAGSTYQDLAKLKIIIESDGDAAKAFRTYAKHWGEMKGFLMALETGGKDLGGVGVQINRLVGFGPVLLGGNQVTGVDADGNLQTGGNTSMGDYMINMVKLQKVLADHFDLKARKNDVTAQMDGLLESVGSAKSAEND